MKHRLSRRQCFMTSMVMGAFMFSSLTACSSEQPKPPAQPTPDQVRSHADRAFDNLKHEEQERAAQPPVPR